MIRKSLMVACVAIALGTAATPGAANTNLTDTWWAPNESGWGVFLTHQGDTAGFGLFHYDAQGRPFFVTGGLTLVARTQPGNYPVLAGALYRSNGPAFGANFDPAQVTREVAGQVSFEPVSPTEARLHLTLNGQAVTKLVARMTVEQRDISGAYRYVQRQEIQPGAPRTYDVGRLIVEQQGNAITMNFEGERSQCGYVGNYAQQGRYGTINGFFMCNDSVAGRFTLTEVEVSAYGLSGKFTQLDGQPGFVRGGFSALPMF